jgi:hypothetical protein
VIEATRRSAAELSAACAASPAGSSASPSGGTRSWLGHSSAASCSYLLAVSSPLLPELLLPPTARASATTPNLLAPLVIHNAGKGPSGSKAPFENHVLGSERARRPRPASST